MQNFLVLSRRNMVALSIAFSFAALVLSVFYIKTAQAASIGTYDQCSNDDGDGYAAGDEGCKWINGNLQSNNSTYIEGDSTVQRLWIEEYVPGSTHTVTFQYGTTKGGKRAYDFLTSWDHSENWITIADRCEGISGCTTASETTLAIPSDPNGSGQFETAGRNFVMRGGTLTLASTPTIVSGSYAGDSETSITVSFTVGPANGPMCTTKQGQTTCGVAIWFGAHIAKSAEWFAFDGTSGAGSISGSPYHVALTQQDSTSVGQRDNQMQANNIIPASTITIHKVTSNQDTTTQFSFTTTGIGYNNFNLVGGGQNQQSIPTTGNFSVTETVPSGWNNTVLTCTASGTGSSATPNLVNHSVAIVIGSSGGAIIDCIYTNAPALGHIIVDKVTVPAQDPQSFDFATTGSGYQAFSLTDQASPNDQTLNAGAYSVSETVPAGWAQTSATCTSTQQGDASTPGNISLQAGETITCTFTNTKQGKILVDKVTTPSGSEQSFEFDPSWSANNFNLTDAASPADSGFLAPGTYSLAEINIPAGWSLSSSSCSDQSTVGNISLQAGETITCTFNNTQSGTVIVKKVMVGGTDTFSYTGTPSGSIAVNNGTIQASVAPGTHASTEGAVAGWDLTSISCDDDNSTGNVGTMTVNFNVAAGETVTCTFTNTKRGHIVVDKITVGGDATFAFDANGGSSPAYTDFNLTGAATPNDQALKPGNYSVSEGALAGWALTNTTCVSSIQDSETAGSLELDAGETITCTFTNTKKPTLTVNKVVVPAEDNGKFNLQIDGVNKATDVGNGGTTGSQEVTIGDHTVGEIAGTGTSLSDYTAVISGDCNPETGVVTLAAGEDKVCTITNTKKGKIIIEKQTLPNGAQGSFNFTGEIIASLSDGGTEEKVVLPGTYFVRETVPAGWDITDITCVDPTTDSSGLLAEAEATFNVAAGETITCVFTNTQKGHIIVDKVTDPAGDAQVFQFDAAGGAYADFSLADADQPNDQELVPGNYNVAESVPNGWDLTSATCTDEQDPANLTLDPGETITCTFNNQKDANIIVIKQTLPDGSAQVFDFTTSYDNDGFALSDGQQNNSGDLDPGTYSVSETGEEGWDLASATCTSTQQGDQSTPASISLQAGETVTCTFTNTQRGHIIVDKVTDPSGDAQSFDFATTGTGYQAFNLTDQATPNDQTLVPGQYSVSETVPAGWDLTSATCTDEQDPANLTLDPGETITCTFNNQKDAKIIVEKQTLPDGSQVMFDFNLSYGDGDADLADGQQDNSGDLDPGTYSVAETPLAGWDLTSTVCTSSNQDSETAGSISLQAGETVTCVFTNTQRGHVIVKKNAIPDGSQPFTFTNDFGNGNPTNFDLTDTAVAGLPEFNAEVLPGKYSVSETVPAGWQQESAVCDQGETVGDIDVAPGETVTCTFTNEKLAKLTLVKNTIGGNGTFDFVMTGATLAPSAQLITASGTASQVFENLDPDNTYTITETPIPSGWANTSATCSGDNTPASITPNAGEEIVCTFVNNKPVAQIDLTPLTATNKIGDNHVITANVQVHSGDGAWGPAANSTVVTFTITNSLGATATFVGGNTCVTAAGVCNITINSPTPGHVEVNGTASPTVLGVVVTATSGTGGNNSADAQKDYVNARISITPLTDTNEVNDDHNFVVTVEQSVEAGVWTPVPEGTLANAIVSPATSIDATDCTNGVNASGQCTVTINSSVAGVFTVTARSTVSVGGVEFKLQTNGTAPNSAPAVKTYVDASISLTPQDAENNVNDPHEIIATVTKNDGSGVTPAANVTVTFTVTSGSATFVGNVNSCVTGGTGTCSVFINSATPGNNVIDASTTFSVGGVNMTRSTDGNSGPGGSDSAEKEYVAGKIIVIKQTNPDGSSQSFEFNPSWSETNFNLKDGESNDSGFIAPGAYNVSEAVPTGWDQTSAICDDQSEVDNISLQAGETVTCTFTNTQRGHLIVQKTTDPSQDETVFTINASGTGTITGGGAGTVTDALDKDYEVTPGTYSVSETVPQGWDKTGDNCQNVVVAAGETKYCLITNTKRGSLEVTKTVVFGNLVNSGSVTETFSITITGPSYPSGDTKTISQAGGVLTWNDLLPGDYTITEADAGAEWTETVPAVAVTVPAGGKGEATVTNTYVPGKLDVTKAVVTTGYLFANDYDATFTIKVSGPSYPLPGGTDLVFNVVNGVLNPATQSLENLIPGTYTVTEADPGIMWTVSGNGNVEVTAGQTVEQTVTNTIKLPSTRITLTPDVWETTPGGNVTLTITDTNNGAVPISSPSVELLANGVPTVPQPTFVSESGTVNGIMDVGETWTWTWTGAINVETVFTVNGIGTDPLGNPVNGPTYASETTSQTIKVVGATRTIGFWQTHTTFTTAIFNNYLVPANQDFIGHDVAVVDGTTHKGTLTSLGQVFGGFYAPIAKTSTGAKRSAVDQARIQMLQQLLAAKLNCAAFGCSAATQTLIANSDAAYLAGANKNTIIALAGQLDAFNNSGDNIAIDPSLPITGKATPKTSQSQALISFWDKP